MSGPTILTISGTSRPDNFTARAVAVVNDELRKRDIVVDYVDARDLDLAFPGHPATDDAKALVEKVKAASAVVLASPEYHGTFCAMTKLILENLGFPSELKNKPVALLGVAAGRIGAIKTLEHLRPACAHMGGIVLPFAVSVAGVRNAFDADGNCTDAGVEQSLRDLAANTLAFMNEYVCPRYELEALVRANGPAWATAI